jgi:hypothetical protein
VHLRPTRRPLARSVGLERLRYRWLVAAITFVAIANSGWAIASSFLEVDAVAPFWLLPDAIRGRSDNRGTLAAMTDVRS